MSRSPIGKDGTSRRHIASLNMFLCPEQPPRSGIACLFFFALDVCFFKSYVLALLRLGRFFGSCSHHPTPCELEFPFVFSSTINGFDDLLLCRLGFDKKCMGAKSTVPRGI